MRVKTWPFTHSLSCTCGGGKSECGILGIVDMKDGSIEIGTSTKKRKYRGHSDDTHIYLDREGVIKLVTVLTEMLVRRD